LLPGIEKKSRLQTSTGIQNWQQTFTQWDGGVIKTPGQFPAQPISGKHGHWGREVEPSWNEKTAAPREPKRWKAVNSRGGLKRKKERGIPANAPTNTGGGGGEGKQIGGGGWHQQQKK